MLLTLTSATPPARELGLILRKHPDRVQSFALGFGDVHVFYPQADDARTTCALALDIDPVALVRGRSTATQSTELFDSYVNDRPYAASSFTSVAIARVLGSALAGKAAGGIDVSTSRALTATIEPIRTGPSGLAARLFAPLGYHVESYAANQTAGSAYERLTIAAQTTVQALLTHLYVLIPVLDDRKHYWVSDDEVEKLFRFGGDWLERHPERELISRRYLRRAPALARAAAARLRALDDAVVDGDAPAEPPAEAVMERPLRLQERRIAAVLDVLRSSGARSVADLGCGEGDLLAALARETQFESIGGSDVSARELERAHARLDEMPMAASRRAQITLFDSSLVYADERLRAYDAVALLEVIEHIDEHRLGSLEQALFGYARPRTIVITTPNREYNALFTTLANGAFRHADHRFEWTRADLQAWSAAVAQRHGYSVDVMPIGDLHPTLGAPTQLAVFRCN